jgi:hypothetical protein
MKRNLFCTRLIFLSKFFILISPSILFAQGKVRANEAPLILAVNEVVTSGNSSCGYVSARWVPGLRQSNGTFLTLSGRISKTQRAVKKAQGANRVRLQAKLAKLKSRSKKSLKLCVTLPPPVPGAGPVIIPTRKGTPNIANTPTPISNAPIVVPTSPVVAPTSTPIPPLPTPSATPTAPGEITYNNATYKILESYYEPITSQVIVWFQVTNQVTNGDRYLSKASLTFDTTQTVTSLGVIYQNSVVPLNLYVETPYQSPVVYGYVFDVPSKPSTINQLLINSEANGRLAGFALTDTPSRKIVPYERRVSGVSYTLRNISYESSSQQLQITYSIVSLTSNRELYLNPSVLTDNNSTTFNSSSMIDPNGVQTNFGPTGVAGKYVSLTLNSPVTVKYNFTIPNQPSKILNFLFDNEPELQLKNITVPFSQ